MRRYALHSLILLIALFIAPCSAPEAVVAPTVVPTSAMLAAPFSTATPALLANTPSPTASAPTPALPFDQALRQLTGRALLYALDGGYLMLDDLDSGATLQLNYRFCLPKQIVTIYGEWSADEHFIAFTCMNKKYSVSIYLLDMQTAATRLIKQGDAVGFEWSPKGSRLLVGDREAAFILDATTGTTTDLPGRLFWESQSSQWAQDPWAGIGPFDRTEAPYVGQNAAAMAWSPDGTKIAVVGDDIKVFDAIEAHARDGRAPVLVTVRGSMTHRPHWSDDGRFIYGSVYYDRHLPLAPSSSVGTRTFRIEISTGAYENVEDSDSRLDSSEERKIWSPDGIM